MGVRKECGRVSRARKFLAFVVVAALVASVTSLIGADSAHADPASPVAQIALNKVTYDQNEPVIVELGAIGFFPDCPGGGVKDAIYPWADIYIIRGQVGPVLADVNGGVPNAVAGFGGGGFFDEVIGYAGQGGLVPGVYSVVVDECQDGMLDANDTVFPDLFTVTARTAVAPLIGIGTLKADAASLAERWLFSADMWDRLVKLEKRLKFAAGFLTNPPTMAIAIGISSFVAAKIRSAALSSFPDPKVVVRNQLLNLGRHYQGISDDPPDPDYAQLTILSALVAQPVFSDPIFETASQLSQVVAQQEALTIGLLQAIERYQGAEAAGDGRWALQHARQAQSFALALADSLTSSASALDAAATDLESDSRLQPSLYGDLGSAVRSALSGFTPEQQALIARSGISQDEIVAELTAIDALDIGGGTITEFAQALRDLASQGLTYAPVLRDFAAANQTIIDGLVADPLATEPAAAVDAGGPYVTTVGVPVQVQASVIAGDAPIDRVEWDLDGNGLFDDAIGDAAIYVPADPRVGYVGVLVTDTNGEQAVDYAAIEVSGAIGLSETSASPPDGFLTMLTTETLPMAFTASSGETQWWVNGVAVAAGTNFTYVPSSPGTDLIEAVVGLSTGVAVSRDWTVLVEAPDLDADGYPANLDCDDLDPDVYPGAPELLDGKDNDCNPSSPDGGEAPSVVGIDPVVGPEGSELDLTAQIDTTGATGPFTATVRWGDGATTAASVSGSDVTASHTYVDDGDFRVEVCVSSATLLVGCDVATAEVVNVAPSAPFVDLTGWTEDNGIDSTAGLAEWIVAEDGRSVLQTQNSDPSFFVSDIPLAGSEWSVSIGVETSGDDDYIGFALGVEPGFTESPAGDDARYLLVDWKQRFQRFGGCVTRNNQGLAVSLVEGIPDDAELWAREECDGQPGTITELARALNYGPVVGGGWEDFRVYRFRFVLTAERFQLYVDEELEIDISSDLIDGDFPVDGRLAFYNFSQDQVRYSNYERSTITTVEGASTVVSARLVDPGLADTHVGRFDFGDGTPQEAVTIVEPSAGVPGTASAGHTYAQDGDYASELCVTDDDGGTSCETITVRVENAPPVVEAGRDRAGGPTFSLDDTTFVDPGIYDGFVARVDWGDGSGFQVAEAVAELGRGLVRAMHTYAAMAAAADYTVVVCVSDDGGGEGCDSFDVHVESLNLAPAPLTSDDTASLEGLTITRGIGFTDKNTSDHHEVSVDWGDGNSESLVVQAGPGGGSGFGEHVYADDGAYQATFTVCDQAGACDSASSIVTIGNQDPVVTLDVVQPDSDAPAEATFQFTDPGLDDTHTALIDWGDGMVEAVSASSAVPGGAAANDGLTQGEVVQLAHAYGTPGAYDVRVCVTDDDDGQGCDMQPVVIVASPDPTVDPDPGPSPTVDPDPTTTPRVDPDPTMTPTVTGRFGSQILGGVAEADISPIVTPPADAVAVAAAEPVATTLAHTGPNASTKLLSLGFLFLALGFGTLGQQRRRRFSD